MLRFAHRGRMLGSLGLALVVGAGGLVGLASLPARATAPDSVHLLASNVLAGLGQLTGTAADPAATMSVGVALARPNPAGEVALYQALYQPGSPLYRHFLTPAQFEQRFGVAPDVYARAVSWLHGAGLTLDASVHSTDYLLATGTVAQVESAFGTVIRQYTSGGTSFLANASAPSVPADVPVLSVVGLNTLQRFSLASHPTRAVSAATPVYGLSSPQSLWSVYQQPSATRGAGQSLAVFGEGASAVAVADLAQFEHENHLPAMPVTVRDVGPGPFTDTSSTPEWDIDTQAISGMAPDAGGLTMYFGSSLVDASVEGLFTTWANDPSGPAQADASFGECERTPLDPLFEQLPGDISQDPNATVGLELGNNLEPVADQTLRQATMEGRTLFASAGDTGSSCPVVSLGSLGAGNGLLNQILPLTNYPASSPYAVAVGGTNLFSSGSAPAAARVAESAWAFTGGGDSLLITAPAYQRGTPGLTLPCLMTPGGQLTNLLQPCRGVPDVAAQSGDGLTNGYSVVIGGQDFLGGGTSLSSPLWAGMWARVNEAAGGAGQGFANETIYRLGKNRVTRARDFFDVTVGTNGLYSAGPGWDYVSGFGTPNLSNLAADAGA